MTRDGAPVERRDVERMTRALAHRGPDGQGSWVADCAGLGHTRLAVIDPAGGAQPMQDEDGAVALTYNGEIYNFAELRAELEALGHRFRTASDTEVLLHAWGRWEEGCLQRLRGMFAFAIVDRRRRVVCLARDHFGIKPLVYFADATRLCFASELQALRENPGFPTVLDAVALDQYLTLSYVPAPLTVYRGVRKLPPAHYVIAHFDGRIEAPVRYWDVEFGEPRRRAPHEWLEELDAVLRESIRAHLVSDVPFGAFLSGGVDSSLLVSLMAEEMREPVRTFSIGFGESGYDESDYARRVSRRWATDHRERTVTPDAVAVLPKLLRHYGEPFGDWSAVPVYYLAEVAREYVPMVLSGDGADEAFAGYPRYWERAARLPVRSFLQRLLAPLRERESFEDSVMTVMREPARRALWRPELRPKTRGPVEEAAERARRLPPLERMRYLDFQGYLPGAILTKVDVATMAHGLEVRTPFVDRRVVELAARLPPEMLVSARDAATPGSRGPVEGKVALKQLLARWFPEDFVHRPKQGFVPPAAAWFSRGGELRACLEAELLQDRPSLFDYFDPAAVRRHVVALDHGGAAEPVWLLYVLERWLAGGTRSRPCSTAPANDGVG